MYKLVVSFVLFIVFIHSHSSFGQKTRMARVDSTKSEEFIYVNPIRAAFFGNSWNLGIGYTHNRSHLFDFDIGRTFGKTEEAPKLGYLIQTITWGIGGATGKVYDKVEADYLGKIYAQWGGGFNGVLLSARIEYLKGFNQEQNHYLKPHVGLSFLYVDLFYSRTFVLNDNFNYYAGNSLNLRLNIFLLEKNWQRTISKNYYYYWLR